MTTKIDWKKPLELRRRYDDKWQACRVVVTDRKHSTASHAVLFQNGSYEEIYWVDEKGCYSGGVCVRNKAGNKKHIILTYRTGSGKLSSKVYDADFKNASTNQPYRVGDNYQGHKVLHTVEFELAS